MKLQINTDQKTIVFEESVELGTLIEWLDKLLPHSEWKTWKLEPKVIQNWVNPIVIDRWAPYPKPYPWYEPFYADLPYRVTCDAGDNTTMPQPGIYNVSLQ